MKLIYTALAVSLLAGCATQEYKPVSKYVRPDEPACTMRSTSMVQTNGKVEAIDELSPVLTPAVQGKRKCSVTFKVQYKNLWHYAYGDATAGPEVGDEDLCVEAVKVGVKQFLAGKEGPVVTMEQQMVCTDKAPRRTTPVEIGEAVRVTDVLPHPARPLPFTYNDATCRMFVEMGTKHGQLYQWQGVMCQTGRNGAGEWTVIDKY